MKTINLRWIYPHYRHDEFVEVSDEVWEVMRQAQREMNNYERRKVYHRAYYSLDAYSWTENYALEHGRSPEEILLEREERAAHSASAGRLAGGPGPCHPHSGPPRPGLLHRRYQPAENCPDGGRTQQQGQHCNPAGAAEYAPLL